MRGTGRRPPRDTPNVSTPLKNYQPRDSDASYASSRPSCSGVGRSATADLIQDRSYLHSCVRAVNAYLYAQSFPLTLRNPLPSAKEITETLIFILSKLEYPVKRLDEDLPVLLKQLKCPFKLNRSAIRAPATPTAWPAMCAVIHWLMQLAKTEEHLSSTAQPFFENDSMSSYALENYLHYIQGNDDAVEESDRNFLSKLEQERDNLAEGVKTLQGTVKELETQLEVLKSGPSERESLEKEIAVMEEDVKKFNAIVAEFSARVANKEKILEEKEKALAVKMEESRMICEENAELKRQVELQTINARDVERMKRELQALERDIEQAEVSRNEWEEKCWDIDSLIGQKIKEIEQLSMECNMTMRRLKLPESHQYVVNAKGSTPAEVMGIDYKTTLKPALNSLADDIQKSSMVKLEELISLQKQSQENAVEIDAKRNRISGLQSQIEEEEAQINQLKKEMEEYAQRCTAESKKMLQDIQTEEHKLDAVERESEEVLKTTKLKLQEASKQSEEEVQVLACELFTLIDSVSKYKECMESKISEMKSDLSEAALAVSNAYKCSLQARLGIDTGGII